MFQTPVEGVLAMTTGFEPDGFLREAATSDARSDRQSAFEL